VAAVSSSSTSTSTEWVAGSSGVRVCQACRGPIYRSPDESWPTFARRKFCRSACTHRKSAPRTLAEILTPRRIHYPGLTVVTSTSEMTAQCSRCGNPWVETRTGFRCYTCPEHREVARLLNAALIRGVAYEDRSL
jgi:hypothetical protein